MSETNDIEKAAEEFVKNQESSSGQFQQESRPNSLGKAQSFLEDHKPLAAEIGWKNIPLQNLPSKGLFYPNGTQIGIRAASVGEIRHWSTIDENDLLGMDDMINYIIEKCCQVKIPGKLANWRDIKEIDRLYLLFAIREFTFKDGENKIYVNLEEGEKVEVRKEMLSYFEIDEKLQKYYNSEKKCFSFHLKTGEEFDLFIPSIGVTSFIKNYVKSRQQQQLKVDTSFVKFAPFLFDDYRTLTQSVYEKAIHDSSMWSLQKISVITVVVDMLAAGINPQIVYKTSGGAELKAPLNFQGGIKSLFIISDIFDQLV